MVATNDRTVTVFGGTGFLGRRIVRHLRAHGFPVRTGSLGPFERPSLIVHGQPIGISVEGEEPGPDLLTRPARRALADTITLELASSHALSRSASVWVKSAGLP